MFCFSCIFLLPLCFFLLLICAIPHLFCKCLSFSSLVVASLRSCFFTANRLIFHFDFNSASFFFLPSITASLSPPPPRFITSICHYSAIFHLCCLPSHMLPPVFQLLAITCSLKSSLQCFLFFFLVVCVRVRDRKLPRLFNYGVVDVGQALK